MFYWSHHRSRHIRYCEYARELLAVMGLLRAFFHRQPSSAAPCVAGVWHNTAPLRPARRLRAALRLPRTASRPFPKESQVASMPRWLARSQGKETTVFIVSIDSGWAALPGFLWIAPV